MPGLSELFFGREGQFRQAPSEFDQPQQQALQNVLQQGIQGLGTDAIENRARQGFQKQTIPLLSTRFANANALGTSGYQNALQDAGTNLETELAALRQGNAMNLLRLGLTPYQGQQYFEPGREGIAGDLTKLAADAGLAYATGGLSKGGNILQYFKKLLGFGDETPQATTEVGTEKSSPLESLFKRQSGLNLLGQAYGAPPTNPYAPTGSSSVFQRPLSTNYPTALNQFKKPGVIPAIRAINQAYTSGLPGAAQGAFMEAQPIQYLETLLGRR